MPYLYHFVCTQFQREAHWKFSTRLREQDFVGTEEPFESRLQRPRVWGGMWLHVLDERSSRCRLTGNLYLLHQIGKICLPFQREFLLESSRRASLSIPVTKKNGSILSCSLYWLPNPDTRLTGWVRKIDEWGACHFFDSSQQLVQSRMTRPGGLLPKSLLTDFPF